MKALKAYPNQNIKTIEINEQQEIVYHYYVPKQIKKVLVLVHGISRNSYEIIDEFSKQADIHGYLLIAPIFTKEFSTDYQRLGRMGKGPRSDYQLMTIINDCKKKLNINFTQFDLFGFSAGAQYAHRFAFAHPNMVKKVALVAAGWYTLPTIDLAYPRGTRIKNQFTDIKFDPQRYLRIKFKVYVGGNDNKRDAALNKSRKIDITQGKNRVSRAKNWVDLMRFQIEKHAIDNSIEMEILTEVEHDFLDCVQNSQLTIKVLNWFNESINHA